MREKARIRMSPGAWMTGWPVILIAAIVAMPFLWARPAAAGSILTSPKGGEVWKTGSVQNITWNAQNYHAGDNYVELDFSANSGATWTQIAQNVPVVPAQYQWTVPNLPTTHARIKIVITNLIANEDGTTSQVVVGADQSPDFTVTQESAPLPPTTDANPTTAVPQALSSPVTPSPPRPLSITDSMGRTIVVPSPPRSMVVCDSLTADAICALGAADRIVGAPLAVSLANMLNQKIENSKDVANLSNPTPVPEKIINLRPDIVFVATSEDPALISRLQCYDIPVVQLNFSTLDALDGSLQVLGQILGEQDRARQLVAFEDKYRDLVAARLKDLPSQDEPRVYWEGAADYSACGKGTPDANILELARLNNVNDRRLPWTTVTPEWVLARDPDAIIRCPDSSKVSSGYNMTTDGMKAHLDVLAQRPGWGCLSAITGGRTYIMSRSLLSGPQAIVGLLYTVKWLYPGLFRDIDPAAVHSELLTTFYGLEYSGAWAYPVPETAAPAS